MRLLVSVRNAAEARSALAGGAEIIDAKEPERGALGPVSRAALREIRAVVPAAVTCSAALGDAISAEEVRHALAQLDVPLAFVKLGFRGLSDPAQVGALLAAAVATARGIPGAPRIVAVGYADYARMESLAPAAFPPLIRAAGATGLLVDSGIKAGEDLFDLQLPATLTLLAEELRLSGAFLALGGSLDAHRFSMARATGAALVGVRGAACVGGRNGVIDEGRVRQLRDALLTAGTRPDPSDSLPRLVAEPRR